MIVCCRRPCDETQAQLTQRSVRRLLAIVGLSRRHRSMGAKQVGERCDRACRKQGRGQQRDEKRCPTIAAISGGKLHLTRVYLRFHHTTRCRADPTLRFSCCPKRKYTSAPPALGQWLAWGYPVSMQLLARHLKELRSLRSSGNRIRSGRL